MEISEQSVLDHNKETLQKFMDALTYFSDRIDSVIYNDASSESYKGRNIITILNIEGDFTPTTPYSTMSAPPENYTGEAVILYELVGLSLQGYYKGSFTDRTLCLIRTNGPKEIDNKCFTKVQLIVQLEYVNDSFPLHEGAIRTLKQQLCAFFEAKGLEVPENLSNGARR